MQGDLVAAIIWCRDVFLERGFVIVLSEEEQADGAFYTSMPVI